jgi:Putative beta-barrel porin 2
MNARLPIVIFAVSGIAVALPFSARAGQSVVAAPQETSAQVEDIGEITEAPPDNGLNGSKFRLNASFRTDFTTNAQLSGSRSSSDVIFFPALEAGYTTSLGHGLVFDITGLVESGIYADHTNRSFISYSAQPTVSWSYGQNWPRFYIGAEPYRFDNYQRGRLITEAVGALGGADWGRSFNSGRSFLFMGYTVENYFSDPTSDNRLGNRAIIGLSEQLQPRLFAQLWYQYEYDNYHDVSRDDSRHSISLNFMYQFSSHLFGSIGESFVDNNSTQDSASYKAFVSSVGLSWQF